MTFFDGTSYSAMNTSCITADANSFGQAGNMHSPESIGGGGGLLFLLLPSISMSRRWQQRRQVTKSISGAAGCSKSGRVVLHARVRQRKSPNDPDQDH